VTNDPRYPYVDNGKACRTNGQPTYRVADLSNPILLPWARDEMRKANDDVFAGKLPFRPRERCYPAGVPGFVVYRLVMPFYFLQTPKEVTIVNEGGPEIRHVFMNVPHSANPKPSWYGESVGHYENGDTLAVDTIGISTKSFVDNYRTPHSDKLHVIERFRKIEDGKKLEVEMTIDDPEAFVKPWKALHRWSLDTTQAKSPGNVTGTYDEEIRCMDGEMVNPLNQIESALLEPLPTANRADF